MLGDIHCEICGCHLGQIVYEGYPYGVDKYVCTDDNCAEEYAKREEENE